MSSEYGKKLRVSIFGQSHSKGIGVVIDGIPAGERFDMEEVLRFMQRRAPGGKAFSTARKEGDEPEILSGLLPEQADPPSGPRWYHSCGAPICVVIWNKDQRSQDYESLRDVPRPSHADYPAYVKYGSFHDIRGGGHFSGRLTAPLCFAGALCRQLLEKRGIYVGAHIASVHGVWDQPFDPVRLTKEALLEPGTKDFPVREDGAGAAMLAEIAAAKAAGDSVGGIIECAAIGLPCGLGEPMFDGVENRIAQIVFGIPAVKGLEFGEGFGCASLFGSENNDPYCLEAGQVRTRTNRAGGILGGLTTGMPLLFRAAVKPTPSIAKEQDSVSLSKGKEERLVIQGRHDPCILPRAVPCMEAALSIALWDMLAEDTGKSRGPE